MLSQHAIRGRELMLFLQRLDPDLDRKVPLKSNALRGKHLDCAALEGTPHVRVRQSSAPRVHHEMFESRENPTRGGFRGIAGFVLR